MGINIKIAQIDSLYYIGRNSKRYGNLVVKYCTKHREIHFVENNLQLPSIFNFDGTKFFKYIATMLPIPAKNIKLIKQNFSFFFQKHSANNIFFLKPTSFPTLSFYIYFIRRQTIFQEFWEFSHKILHPSAPKKHRLANYIPNEFLKYLKNISLYQHTRTHARACA